MLTATEKQHSVVHGFSRFAQVSVCRPELHETDVRLPQPEVLINGHSASTVTETDDLLIQAALQGIRQAERDFGWNGPPHCVLKIEGLAVDGIDVGATRHAAYAAAKALIKR